MPVYFFGVRKRHRFVDGKTRKYSYRLIWAQSKNAIIDELKLGFGFSDKEAHMGFIRRKHRKKPSCGNSPSGAFPSNSFKSFPQASILSHAAFLMSPR